MTDHGANSTWNVAAAAGFTMTGQLALVYKHHNRTSLEQSATN